MARLSPHHEELTDGVGKCSVPMWMHGCPAGFCDAAAYGPQTQAYRDSFKGRDPRYFTPAYASGLACPAHGGPAKPDEPTPQVPTPEELAKLLAPTTPPALKVRASVPWNTFCTVSLFNWLQAAAAAGVPYVPAVELCRVPVESLLLFDQEGRHEADLQRCWATVAAAEKPNHMVRWDCCAGLDVKSQLGMGRTQWSPEFHRLIIDDPRAYEIIYDYPRAEMIVWQRPWIDALIHERYPVEFRVFIRDSRILGVANYYPQRALTDDEPRFRTLAENAAGLATKIVSAIKPPVVMPRAEVGQTFDPGLVHGTCDFLATPAGELLFLEGGPPFGAGAHPCAFQTHGRISGIALNATPQDEEF